jgi:hypothetical protein
MDADTSIAPAVGPSRRGSIPVNSVTLISAAVDGTKVLNSTSGKPDSRNPGQPALNLYRAKQQHRASRDFHAYSKRYGEDVFRC